VSANGHAFPDFVAVMTVPALFVSKWFTIWASVSPLTSGRSSSQMSNHAQRSLPAKLPNP
jgi:hypothetical protein